MEREDMVRLRSGLRRSLKDLKRRKAPLYEDRIVVLEMQIAEYNRRIAEDRDS